MTADSFEGQAGAHSAELAPLAVPDSARRRAGIVVCSQAGSVEEARELLDMLGLLDPDALPQPAPAPPAPPAPKRPKPPTSPKPTPAARRTAPAATSPSPTVTRAAQRTAKPVGERVVKPEAASSAPSSGKSLSAVESEQPGWTLTRADVDTIRGRWATDEQVTQRELAEDYHVEQQTIADIVRYVTWTDSSPIIGTCVGCSRAMVTQKAYLQTPAWGEKGFARHGAGDRCNGCYSAWRRRGTAQARPRFAAHNVTVQPYYAVICQQCGPVGEPPTSREAANSIRATHLLVHRQPQLVDEQPHHAGHALGLAEHTDRGEPPCPACQELLDLLTSSGHLAPGRTA